MFTVQLFVFTRISQIMSSERNKQLIKSYMEDALKVFMDNLYNLITCNTKLTCSCSNIIRKHSEALHEHGDFSFPAHLKPWLPHLSPESLPDHADIHEHFEKCCQMSTLVKNSADWSLNIVSISNKSNRIALCVNRAAAAKLAILQCIKNNDFVKNAFLKKTTNVFEDISQRNEDSLINLRVTHIRQVIENLCALCLSEGDVVEVIVSARASREPSGGARVVICGAVLNVDTGAKETTLSAQDYIKQRQSEMTLIAQHKYGVRESSAHCWGDLLSRLGSAAVAFELLQARPASAVKINFHHPTAGSSKGAAFVLYNCARLETLVRTFEEKVTSGQYPSPPDTQHTDFTLLTHEDEWNLLFNYVLGFPSVLASCLRIDGATCTVAPHLLCNFLSSLVRTFSQYYRRVRILTEGRAHMMPVLYARLQLLTALNLVLHAALRVLNISAVSRM